MPWASSESFWRRNTASVCPTGSKRANGFLREKMERPPEDVKKDVLDFFRTRYQYFLLDKGYSFDVIDAVFSTSFDELLDAQDRLDALRGARTSEDFASLVIASKRAMNILKGAALQKGLDPSLLKEPAEQDLYRSLSR